MKSWLTALTVLSMILLGNGDVMAGVSKKPVKKNGVIVQMARGKPWTDKGTTLLEPGTRHNVVDPGVNIDSKGMMLELMNANLLHRRKGNHKPQNINITPHEQRLRGLFGGDKDK